MKRRLILSNQQLISLLEVLGYDPILMEEVQYRCRPDGACEPVIVSTINIRLNDCCLPELGSIGNEICIFLQPLSFHNPS